jgi:hypothetical protein
MLLHPPSPVGISGVCFVGSKSVGVLTGYLAGFAVSRLTMYGDSLDKFHMIKVKETGMKNESIIMIRQLV